jgi:hypothetical protein
VPVGHEIRFARYAAVEDAEERFDVLVAQAASEQLPT